MNKKETYYAIEDIGGFPASIFPDVIDVDGTVETTAELKPNFDTR